MKLILIGPMGVGKTTIAKKLSEYYNIPYYDFDELRWSEFLDIDGYSKEIEREIASNSQEDLFKYWKPFEAEQVVRMVKYNSSGVFDFGAGHSFYEDDNLFNKVYKVLKDEPYVFYLRYSDNKKESVEALSTRNELPDKAKPFYKKLNTTFIKSNCNDLLSKYIIDRKDKDFNQVMKEISKIIEDYI